MKFSQLVYILKNLKKGQVQEIFYNAFRRPPTFFKAPVNPAGSKTTDGDTVVIRPGDGFLDHIEMSGERVSAVVSYAADEEGFLTLRRHVVFPFLRLKSDLTFSSFCFNDDAGLPMQADGSAIDREYALEFRLRGGLETVSAFGALRIRRKLFPLPDEAGLGERTEVENRGTGIAEFSVADGKRLKSRRGELKSGRATYGAYLYDAGGRRFDGETVFIRPKERYVFYAVYGASENDEFVFDAVGQELKRDEFVNKRLTETTLRGAGSADLLYSYSVIRGTESVFETENGLLHSPGGKFYAAIWANDELEYAAPAFALLGDRRGIESAKNAIALYERYVSPNFGESLPSSLVSGGQYPLGIAGDRGDTAMVGSGTALFLLYLGDREYAAKKLPFIDWCASFCASRLTADGVVASDSDELEGRFPSGKCNLATNINYLELLRYAALLHRDLDGEREDEYRERARNLEDNIESYFGGTVEKYDTYRYYEGNKKLRSWICLPLAAGLRSRADETARALFERLFEGGKMRTASNKRTVWDRSLLYAVKGLYRAGKIFEADRMLAEYSAARLTGEHAPYPYEAFPEGNGAHLSAESLLFVRAVAEGLFGVRPTGLGKVAVIPTKGLRAELKGLCAGGAAYTVSADGGRVTVSSGGRSRVFDGEAEIGEEVSLFEVKET